MNKLHIVTALLLAAVAQVFAGEPFCARKINVWTGRRGEPSQVNTQWLAAASAIAGPGHPGGTSGEYRPPHSATAPSVTPQTVARGLRSPDGLAIHPKTGVLYVSQEDSGFSYLRAILVDKETGVNYLFVQSGYAGGLTPLLDADGKPVVTKKDN